MPPHVNLERLIGTAVVDREFRTALLQSPASAAASFDLSDEELGILESAHANTLEELAVYVFAWIARMPRPRRATARRWSFEDFQSARAAYTWGGPYPMPSIRSICALCSFPE